jgi:dihydroorotase
LGVSGGDWLITGGRVVDPANEFDAVADLLVRNGQVVEVGRAGASSGAKRFDASEMVVSPGWIDLHVHLRVPGQEHKETIATGTAAAAAGGFTTICCMPNTEPALDSVSALAELKDRIAREASVRVRPIAAISAGRQGREPVDYDALVAAGAVGFSDDGDSTLDSGVMRQALAATLRHRRPVMVHCEDKGLAGPGAMHEGDVSRELGLAGIPAEAEEIVIARDLMLARLTGGWLHVLHVSTGRGAAMVGRAKSEGVNVTAEVMPHHLLMDDTWVAGNRSLLNVAEPTAAAGRPADPNTKVNPPLRTADDTRQLLAALQDGVFDVVATDHAPHAAEEKDGRAFGAAAFGMSGLEFALPLMLALVRAGHLSLSEVVRRTSVEPARLLGEPLGSLAPGSVADIVVFDPAERWTVTPEILRTKSKNTPLLGMELQGRAKLTLVGGEERFGG